MRSKKVKHPRITQDVIVSFLRDPILAGDSHPGDRLPSQMGIAKKLKTSSLTVKRAMQQLVAHGFARTKPGVGTFVADHPPHRFRYALAFPDHPVHLEPVLQPTGIPMTLLGVW